MQHCYVIVQRFAISTFYAFSKRERYGTNGTIWRRAAVSFERESERNADQNDEWNKDEMQCLGREWKIISKNAARKRGKNALNKETEQINGDNYYLSCAKSANFKE